eukprot:1038159-Prorocentrum_lima.AAC.1
MTMGVPDDHPIPGMLIYNSWVDRDDRTVLEGARCLLHQAHLPLRCWPHAVRHFRLACNAIGKTLDGTPWFARFREVFVEYLLPFGCLVH